MLIIGESLNATIPKVGQAIQSRDAAFVSKLAQEQRDAGAQMLDVNAAVPGGNETEDLTWLVTTVQAAVDVPLMLDSASPDALRGAIAVCKQRPLVNSVSGEPKKLEKVLPLVAEYGCSVVALCIGEKGIPGTPEARLDVARLIVQRAGQLGIKPESIYIDPLVLTIATDIQSARISLATIELIRGGITGVHTIGGISNVSFGLPGRSLLNAAFVAMAAGLGMDAFLVNVRDRYVIATISAANTLAGNDTRCRDYLRAYRAGRFKV